MLLLIALHETVIWRIRTLASCLLMDHKITIIRFVAESAVLLNVFINAIRKACTKLLKKKTTVVERQLVLHPAQEVMLLIPSSMLISLSILV